jgi:hypothetical protein
MTDNLELSSVLNRHKIDRASGPPKLFSVRQDMKKIQAGLSVNFTSHVPLFLSSRHDMISFVVQNCRQYGRF